MTVEDLHYITSGLIEEGRGMSTITYLDKDIKISDLALKDKVEDILTGAELKHLGFKPKESSEEV